MEQRRYPSLQQFLTELNTHCLLLARHGETDWNAMNIIQGQQDRPLSLKGFAQRRNLFFLLGQVTLSRIWCSTLQRTIQTALPISQERDIELEQRPELNEARLGVFEGLPKEDVAASFPKDCYQSFLDDEVNVVLPGGGESLRMVDQRVRPIVVECVSSVARSGHMLIVGHRNVNKVIIKNLLGLSLAEGYAVEHKNCWLYIFAPELSELFLVNIPHPHEPILVQAGYAKIDAA